MADVSSPSSGLLLVNVTSSAISGLARLSEQGGGREREGGRKRKGGTLSHTDTDSQKAIIM